MITFLIDIVGKVWYNRPSTVYRLPSTVYRLPSTVYRLPSTVYRLPSHHNLTILILLLYFIYVPYTISTSAIIILTTIVFIYTFAEADTQVCPYESLTNLPAVQQAASITISKHKEFFYEN